MTVIAWDGKMLAADKRSTHCGLARTVTKITRHDRDTLLALSGDQSVALEMLRWFKDGCSLGNFPAKARDDEATLTVVMRGGAVVMYTTGPVPAHIEDRQIALGSGRDYALAAMHLGHDARTAVEVACHFEVHCGNGIDTLEFEP